MPTAFSTEQLLTIPFQVLDGRGRPVDVDEVNNPPKVISSDETVITGSVAKNPDPNVAKGWIATINSVGASPMVDDGAGGQVPRVDRAIIDVDADVGNGVQDIMSEPIEVSVTLDPRTASRTFAVGAPATVDKPI